MVNSWEKDSKFNTIKHNFSELNVIDLHDEMKGEFKDQTVTGPPKILPRQLVQSTLQSDNLEVVQANQTCEDIEIYTSTLKRLKISADVDEYSICIMKK